MDGSFEQRQTRGLTKEDAAQRLERYGRNRLPEPPLPGVFALFLRQFLSPFIYILLIAAIVSFALQQWPSGVFIVLVLLLNAVIGTVQEFSATRAAAALRKMVHGSATVIRDGEEHSIDVEEVVPGDLVLLASGDKVPADIRLLTSRNVSVDESMLTGESLAVTKNAQAEVADGAPLGERFNQVFAGTILTNGRARGEVTATGLHTEIGKIAGRVTARRLSEPPLLIRIRRFTYKVAAAIGVAILLLTGIMLVRGGYGAEGMVLMAIGLAVSTIPEGLPAALTVALAIGMRRMARRNVIIRKLVAVEGLGSCTFICSDKTGTLTVNELTVRRVLLPDGQAFDITGEGVAPGGEVRGQGDMQRLRELCTTGALANESQLDYAGGEWDSTGDIVDVAFLVLAKKAGLSLTQLRSQRRQLDLIPYESERAFSGSLNHQGEDGRKVLNVKGSPEKMLALCTQMMTADGPAPIDRPRLQTQFEQLGEQGYRVLALARREAESTEQLEDMVFLGLVAMIDPIRPEAHGAIKRCRDGGIDVAMITGDHPATARAIAQELGLCGPHDPVITGAMLREAEPKGGHTLDELIRSARVFARIEPRQKERIVASLMQAGHFVAVTGDGVNDAPAMRAANIGIAMGKRGTDVARETADLIITDDNFASIVDGVEEGRVVYNNIRKVIGLLIATGFSAILLFFCTAVAGLPMPMIAVQLLWLNLVANGLQDVALAFEPKEGGELDERPRAPSEPIFERHIIEHVLVTGTVMGGLAFTVYFWLMGQGTPEAEARNLVLMLMVLFGNIHALESRSERRSLFRIRFLANPFLVLAVPFAQLIHIGAMYTPGLSDVLQLQPISFQAWAMLLGVALILLVVEEIHKWTIRRREPHDSRHGTASARPVAAH
ncbi:MAG: cation-translocating P-type ATPase [Rhodothalassiaceae bacterium]